MSADSVYAAKPLTWDRGLEIWWSPLYRLPLPAQMVERTLTEEEEEW